MIITKNHINLELVIGSVVSIGCLYACIKPYDFDSDAYDKILVVEAAITNEDGPHEISISYTYPLEGTSTGQSINNATIWVESGSGDITNFSRSEEGKYQSPASFKAEAGEAYQLFIEMSNGESFQSTIETMTEAPGIDSIYGMPSVQPTSEGDRNTTGVQFFIDSKLGQPEAKYFRYEWEEAYKIRTPYASNYTVDENNTIVQRPINIGICYNENSSNELIYGSSIGSSEKRLVEFPIRFISDETPLLRIRYTILVKQYAISESAYLFYKKLNENNQSGGSLFDKQTGSVFGNITSNNDQPILGYFEVSGISTERKYFDFRDLEHFAEVKFPFNCLPQNGLETSINQIAFYEEIGYNLVYFSIAENTAFLHTRPCTDCTYYASTTPPDYWIE